MKKFTAAFVALALTSLANAQDFKFTLKCIGAETHTAFRNNQKITETKTRKERYYTIHLAGENEYEPYGKWIDSEDKVWRSIGSYDDNFYTLENRFGNDQTFWIKISRVSGEWSQFDSYKASSSFLPGETFSIEGKCEKVPYMNFRKF